MSSIMAEPTHESIATRETLLNRLKDCQMFELYVVRQWPSARSGPNPGGERRARLPGQAPLALLVKKQIAQLESETI